MRSEIAPLIFHDLNSKGLFDQHQRLIHSRLYSNALNPSESLTLLHEGIIFKHKGNADFGVILSHDVDHLYIQKAARTFKHRGGIKSALQLLVYEAQQKFNKMQAPIRERASDYDIRTLLDWEIKNNIPASYYFLSLHPGSEDFNYHLSEVEDILNGVIQSKGEVGLHGGHESTKDGAVLLMEKSDLEVAAQLKVSGFRSHYLKWKPEATEVYLEKAGFLYDTSWGSAQQPGFIKGFSTPHPVWNTIENRYYTWVEIPLIAMDCSFFDYMKLSSESAWDLFIQLVDSVKKTRGVLTILWHNSYHKHLSFYWRMLEYLQNQNAYFGTGEEFAHQALETGFIDQLKQYYDQRIA
jgi:hypothetical protein